MMTLPELLDFVFTTLQTSPLCHSVRVIETQQFSERQFAIKVRADLTSGDWLQVRLYCNESHMDYAYHVARSEQTTARWDNKEHFPQLSSFPHHHHLASGEISESPLTGDPQHDLPLILTALTDTGNTKSQS